MLDNDDLLARSRRVSNQSAELAEERRRLSGHHAKLIADNDRLGVELVRAVPLSTLANWLEQREPVANKGQPLTSAAGPLINQLPRLA